MEVLVASLLVGVLVDGMAAWLVAQWDDAWGGQRGAMSVDTKVEKKAVTRVDESVDL
jgi:hypothetical protein